MVHPVGSGGGSSASSPGKGGGPPARTSSFTIDEIRRGLQRNKEANASRSAASSSATRSLTTPINGTSLYSGSWNGAAGAPPLGTSGGDRVSATLHLPSLIPSRPTSPAETRQSALPHGVAGDGSSSSYGGTFNEDKREETPQQSAAAAVSSVHSMATSDSLGGSFQRSVTVPNYPLADGALASSNVDATSLRVVAAKLAQICQESLVYIDVLDASRSRIQAENSRLRGQIREFEGLLDDSRERERQHLETAQAHRDGLSKFETKYKHIKEKAKATIQDCQGERDKHRRDHEELRKRTEILDADLAALQPQLAEVERLRGASRAVHEVQEKLQKQDAEMVDLHLKVRRLENDNGQLATERTKLQQQVDELQGLKHDRGGRRSILGSDDLFDRNHDEGSPKGPLGDGVGGGEEKRLLHETRMIIGKLESQLRERDEALDKAQGDIQHFQKESTEYQQYVEALLARVEQQS